MGWEGLLGTRRQVGEENKNRVNNLSRFFQMETTPAAPTPLRSTSLMRPRHNVSDCSDRFPAACRTRVHAFSPESFSLSHSHLQADGFTVKGQGENRPAGVLAESKLE